MSDENFEIILVIAQLFHIISASLSPAATIAQNHESISQIFDDGTHAQRKRTENNFLTTNFRVLASLSAPVLLFSSQLFRSIHEIAWPWALHFTFSRRKLLLAFVKFHKNKAKRFSKSFIFHFIYIFSLRLCTRNVFRSFSIKSMRSIVITRLWRVHRFAGLSLSTPFLISPNYKVN